MSEKSRFIYEYMIPSESTTDLRKHSVTAETEAEADEAIIGVIADFEFVEPEEVQLIGLLRTIGPKDNYYECEGCT